MSLNLRRNNQMLLLSFIVVCFLVARVKGVLVGSQFVYDDSTNPQCSGDPFVQFPLTIGNVCFDSDQGVGGSSIFLDCQSKSINSYLGKGCKPESLAFEQSGCTPAGEGISYTFECLDVPADQLLLVETGISCEANAIKNRTQVSVIQLNKCFVFPASSFRAFQSGELFRLENYNNTECRNDPDTQVSNVYPNNLCVAKLNTDGTSSQAYFAQRADFSPIIGNSAVKQTSLLVSGGILVVSILSLF